MIFQATMREAVAKQFGVSWSDVTNGRVSDSLCAGGLVYK